MTDLKINRKIEIKGVAYAGLLWGVLPVLIWIIFWFRWYYALPAALLLTGGVWQALDFICKSDTFKGSLRIDWKIYAVLIFIAVWMLSIGIGGFLGQERWDNSFRNAVLVELIDRSWPVVCTEYKSFAYLSYYFCYWIIPGAIGKLFASHQAGFIALYLWSYIGLAVATLLMMWHCKRKYLFIGVLMLLFSTPDIFNYLVFSKCLHWFDNPIFGVDILSASSAGYLATFIYNQGIPAYVLLMLYFCSKDARYGTLLVTLLFCFTPFMALPLIPIEGVRLLKNYRGVLTISNISALAVASLAAIFYLGNGSTGSMMWLWDFVAWKRIVILMACWLAFNYCVYLPFIWKSVKCDKMFWGLLLFTICFSLPVPEYGNYDFGWKVPAAFSLYFMYKLFPYLSSIRWNVGNWRAWIIGSLIFCGLFSNVAVIGGQTVRLKYIAKVYVLHMPDNHPEVIKRSASLEGKLFDPKANELCYDSFVTDRSTIYSRYFMP